MMHSSPPACSVPFVNAHTVSPARRVARTPGGCQIGYMDGHTGCHQLVLAPHALLGLPIPKGVRLVTWTTILAGINGTAFGRPQNNVV
jgi:hypothetical protein